MQMLKWTIATETTFILYGDDEQEMVRSVKNLPMFTQDTELELSGETVARIEVNNVEIIEREVI